MTHVDLRGLEHPGEFGHGCDRTWNGPVEWAAAPYGCQGRLSSFIVATASITPDWIDLEDLGSARPAPCMVRAGRRHTQRTLQFTWQICAACDGLTHETLPHSICQEPW